MSQHAADDPAYELVSLYDRAFPEVYGYLVARCGQRSVAEELTSETFMAAVDAVRRVGTVVSTPWLIGTARHKLVDHWRGQAREQRSLRAIGEDVAVEEDPWDVRLDAVHARATLAQLGPHHRAALTLRYLDDLPVPDVAVLLGRTVHATEALLVRAKSAFRRAYSAGGGCDV